MGSLQAAEMANAVRNDEVTFRQAIVWHLRSNCFPPVPGVMVDPAMAAISLIEAGEDDTDIVLPEGVSYRGYDTVLPWELVESFRLNAFIDFDEFAANADLEGLV